jgi:hypothetical protein
MLFGAIKSSPNKSIENVFFGGIEKPLNKPVHFQTTVGAL